MCHSVRDKHPRATLDDVSLNPVLISRAMWSSALRPLQGRMAQDGLSPTKAPTVRKSLLGTVSGGPSPSQETGCACLLLSGPSHARLRGDPLPSTQRNPHGLACVLVAVGGPSSWNVPENRWGSLSCLKVAA